MESRISLVIEERIHRLRSGTRETSSDPARRCRYQYNWLK